MAVAIAAYSAYQGMEAQKAAGEEADKQRALEERSLALAEQRQRDAQARMDKEEALFRPIKERVIGEAQAEKPAGWDKQANIINQGYGDVIRKASTGPYGSGLGAALVQGANLGKTSSLASAYADAKEKQRQSLAALMDKGMSSVLDLRRSEESAGNTQLGQMGQMAASHGNWASQYGKAASNAYGNAISGIGKAWAGGEFGKIGDLFSSKQSGQTDYTKAYPGMINTSATGYSEPEFESSINRYSNMIPTNINTDYMGQVFSGGNKNTATEEPAGGNVFLGYPSGGYGRGIFSNEE